MKYKVLFATSLLAAFALVGCGTSAASAEPQDSSVPTVEEAVYRGTVDEVLEDGSVKVSQLHGYDYGQQAIVFHISDETTVENPFETIEAGAFVEVRYNGILTRSMPPQGTADELRVISSYSEGVIVNGTIETAEETADGWRISLIQFDVPDGQVILNVPKDALEQITAEELVEGAEVSAVTSGIATMSLPPQMPVEALLPFHPATAE